MRTVAPPSNDAHTLNGMTHVTQATLSQHVSKLGGALNEDKTAHVIIAAGQKHEKAIA